MNTKSFLNIRNKFKIIIGFQKMQNYNNSGSEFYRSVQILCLISQNAVFLKPMTSDGIFYLLFSNSLTGIVTYRENMFC